MGKVSIIMPVYNGSKYLVQALDSILLQSYNNWELLVIDDASTDRTAEILRSYLCKDKRVKYFRNDMNLGLSASLNKGLSNAVGVYLARMDGDDVSDSRRIDLQVRFLEDNPDYGIVGVNGHFVDEDGEVIRASNFPVKVCPSSSDLEKSAESFFHGSWMMTRQCFERVGGYNELLFSSEDKDLWLRVSEQYSVGNLELKLYHYRIHTEAFTSRTVIYRKLFRKVVFDNYLLRRFGGLDYFGLKGSGLLQMDEIPKERKESFLVVSRANQEIGTWSFFSSYKDVLRPSLMRITYHRELSNYILMLHFELLFTRLSRGLLRRIQFLMTLILIDVGLVL